MEHNSKYAQIAIYNAFHYYGKPVSSGDILSQNYVDWLLNIDSEAQMKMIELRKVILEIFRALEDNPGKYKLVMVPDASLDGFYGFALHNPKDRKIYISDKFKGRGDELRALREHEEAHKDTSFDNYPILDEFVANLVSCIEEPEGFFKLLWRTVSSWERIRFYWDTYVRKV